MHSLIYLLNQKASILHQLRTHSPAYEDQALEFLEFRAHAIPKDYPGLSELIEIYSRRGCPERAWAFIEANLACKPFSIQEIARRTEIPIEDFRVGFRYSRLYGIFRERFSLEDHCITLCGYGLAPDAEILKPINYVLIAPFGILAQRILEARKTNTPPDTRALFKTTLNRVSRLFPIFGARWLSKTKPVEKSQQTDLLSAGIAYLTDGVAAESARLVAFVAGYYGITGDIYNGCCQEDWKEVAADITPDS